MAFTTSIKTVCLTACAVSALALGLAQPAAAQDGQEADGAEAGPGRNIETLVVTTRRVEESLQDTPIAVSVVTQQSLEERDIPSITGLAEIAPNTNFSFAGTSSGSDSAAVIFIRGVGQNDFTLVTDPGVGVYIDGVYLGRTIGSVIDVFDISQAEVARGPQGTLFGRNTIGGAINLTTRDPGREFGGRIRAIAGDDDRFETTFSLDLPITEDLSIGLSGLHRQRDGTVTRTDGTDLGDDNVFGGRIKAVWEPSSNWRSEVSFDYVQEEEEGAAEVLLDSIEASAFVSFFNNNTFGNGSVDEACAMTDPPGGPQDNPNCANDQFVLGPFNSAENGVSQNDIMTYGISLTNSWQVRPNLEIKTITAFRDVAAEFARPSDGTPFDIFQTLTDYDQNQFSQEIQLIGSSFDERLQWVGGFFYFEEEGISNDIVSGIVPDFPRDIGAEIDNNNWAVFGEATLDITNRLRILGGLRYTDETKNTDLTSVSLVTGQDFLSGEAAGVIEQNFSELTWRASAIYDVIDEASVYFTASRGFKSGGVVQRITVPNSVAPTFEPEFVDLYEIGLKSEFLDYGLRLNIAGFISDYSDIQLDGVVPGTFGTVQFNAGTADIKGVEVEFDWVPTRRLQFVGALGYIDAEYTELAEGSLVSLEDSLIRTPEITWSLSSSFLVHDGSIGAFTGRADWVYESETAFEPENTPLTTEDGFHRLDLSMVYDHPREAWRVIAGVNNVTDEEYLVAADFNGTIGYELGIFARPRNWFVSVAYEF